MQQHRDAAGVVGSQVATQANSALTAAAVYNDATGFSGFRANAEPGTDLVDNFAVVPEPSTVGLLSLAALGAFGIRRRR